MSEKKRPPFIIASDSVPEEPGKYPKSDETRPSPIARYPTVVLPLPANPYLETTPWLDWMPLRDELKIDTLQLPCGTLENMANDDVCRHRSADLPISCRRSSSWQSISRPPRPSA